MTSVMTNTASIAANSTLRRIEQNMERTQGSVSSGYRVSSATDNAAYWSIATTMRSDDRALGAVKDALALSAALTDSSYSSLNAIVDVTGEIKKKLVLAREPGVDRTKVNSELKELKEQLVSITEGSYSFGRSLIFDNDASALPIVSMVGSFTRDDHGNVAVSTIDFDTDKSTLIDNYDAANGILTRPTQVEQPSGATAQYYLIEGKVNVSGREIVLGASTTDDDVTGMIQAVDTMLGTVIDAAALVGAARQRIDLQTNFTDDLMDANRSGVGTLIDAEMNEQSSRLKSLQVQKQLGVEALSIANATPDNVVRLFS